MRPFLVGDEVDVWSASRKRWMHGRVTYIPTGKSGLNERFVVALSDVDGGLEQGSFFDLRWPNPGPGLTSSTAGAGATVGVEYSIPVGKVPSADQVDALKRQIEALRKHPVTVGQLTSFDGCPHCRMDVKEHAMLCPVRGEEGCGCHPELRAAGVSGAALVKKLLDGIAPHVDSETPRRFHQALLDLTSGYYGPNAEEILKTFPLPDSGADPGIVIVRDVPFASVCEHHVLPFTGTISVAYLPSDRIVGLSKIPRLIRHVTRKLQVQERIGSAIADAMTKYVGARGVMVVIRSQHTCMTIRGVESQGSMVTSTVRGVFEHDSSARAEALQLMK